MVNNIWSAQCKTWACAKSRRQRYVKGLNILNFLKVGSKYENSKMGIRKRRFSVYFHIYLYLHYLEPPCEPQPKLNLPYPQHASQLDTPPMFLFLEPIFLPQPKVNSTIRISKAMVKMIRVFISLSCTYSRMPSQQFINCNSFLCVAL